MLGKKASRNYVKVLELFKQKGSNAVLLLNTVNECRRLQRILHRMHKKWMEKLNNMFTFDVKPKNNNNNNKKHLNGDRWEIKTKQTWKQKVEKQVKSVENYATKWMNDVEVFDPIFDSQTSWILKLQTIA